MRVLSLGHSAFLLEIESDRGETVRILGDPWLSDHAIGDLMGRFPRVRIAWEKVPPIHGLFISHSHTDHFDPYTLTAIWKCLPQRPAILLPQSIEYLAPLLVEFLDGCEVVVLEENAPCDLQGLSVSALFNLETEPTNEDDVMLLVVENGREAFICESDALFPFHDIEARAAISQILANPELETACLHTTRNELEATMASLHARSRAERRAYVTRCEEEDRDEIRALYAPAPELEADEDLWRNPRLVRLIGGQGLCYPQQLTDPWNHVLFPIRVRDRVAMERDIAGEYDLRHGIEEFRAGEFHILEDGRLRERRASELVEVLDHEESRAFDGDLELFENFPSAPLRDESRPVERQRAQILAILNDRFLPYLIGARRPPVEHLLSQCGGRYRIRVRYGIATSHDVSDYIIDFAQLRFRAEDAAAGGPDEEYWANDLEDYLEGLCDDFSTFCRHALGGDAQRLWDCLGMPYLNNDLVLRKLRYHFERAHRGEEITPWVLAHYR